MGEVVQDQTPTERAWRKRFEEAATLGQSLAEYCAARGLVAQQGQWWRSEIKRREARRAATARATAADSLSPQPQLQSPTAGEDAAASPVPRQKRKRRRSAASSARPEFKPLTVIQQRSPALDLGEHDGPVIRVVLLSGRRLEVGASIEPARLVELVRLLEGV